MRARIVLNNVEEERPCALCEGVFSPGLAAVELTHKGAHLGDVCRRCLALTPAALLASAKGRAARLRMQAAELDAVAPTRGRGRLVLPSLAALDAAAKKNKDRRLI